MDKWNLIIDVAECSNCNNCVLAAKDELAGNDFPGYSAPHAAQGPGVIRIERTVRGSASMVDAAYVPRMCNHCDAAPCVVAGDGAVTKRDDGIVLIDPRRAVGRRDLVASCPYGAIIWNEAEQLPQSWFFDAHLLDAGAAAPRGVSVCPTRAMKAVKASDEVMAERVRAQGLRVLKPELGTQPRVYYRNLHRADHCFVGGSVTARIDGRIECIVGAPVELVQGGTLKARAVTDGFGDFKFDELARDSGDFEVRVSHRAHGGATCTAHVGSDSVVLGSIELWPVTT